MNDEPRFPVGPLEEVALSALGRRGFCPVGHGGGFGRDMRFASVGEVAAIAGTSPRQWRRWREIGVDAWTADRLAVAFGRHPGELWPQWWEVPA